MYQAKIYIMKLSHVDETLNLRNLKRSAFMPGIIQIDDINQSQALIGNNDENLKAIEAHFNVVIHARGQEIAVKGEK